MQNNFMQNDSTDKQEKHTVKLDPWLIGAIDEAMGGLPSSPRDLSKIKSLTVFNKSRYNGEDGWILLNWIEVASGYFSVIGEMPNLHTLLFKNTFTAYIRDFSFLSQCKNLKKLDLSGTNFSDCALLAELSALSYVLLPDRRQLIHTEVLETLAAKSETEFERDERSRAIHYLNYPKSRGISSFWNPSKLYSIDYFTELSFTESSRPLFADLRLIQWIASSLEKFPDSPSELSNIRMLDSLASNVCIDSENLPSWIQEKKGDFSLIGKLPNLQVLLLWNVSLDDFSFLPDCKQLLYINLWNTNFTDCNLLASLPFLRYVYLPEKEKLKDYSLLEDIHEMQLSGFISELEDFFHKSDMPTMEQISDILENPSSNSSVLLVRYQTALLSSAAKELDPKAASEKSERKILSNSLLMQDHSQTCDTYEYKNDSETNTETNQIKKQQKKNNKISSFYQDDEYDDLEVVHGEDIIISFEGDSNVRYVTADFYMDFAPSLWKSFCRLKDEKDNWANLSPSMAHKLTNELYYAVVHEDIRTLCLSLDSWGESAFLSFEFAGGWASIDIRDDDAQIDYVCYNPDYTKASELSPVEVGGQSPVPKMLALNDLNLTADIIRYFLETGRLLPGTLWKKFE